jgi:hypothetical protein
MQSDALQRHGVVMNCECYQPELRESGAAVRPRHRRQLATMLHHT